MFSGNLHPILFYRMKDFNYLPNRAFLNKCGIYSITHRATQKTYVGSSKQIYYRMAKHKTELLRSKHCNQHLQNAVDRYGISEFDVEVIEECNENDLADRENYWIEQRRCLEFGYNQCMVTKLRKNNVAQCTRSKISKSLMDGKSILMCDKSSGNVLREFPSLYDAAEYIIEEGSSSGSPFCVRMRIGEVIRNKLVPVGKKRKARRPTAFGYKWRAE